MPAVTRELKITYGSYVVGGSTDNLIDGYINLTKNFSESSVEFEFVITAAREAAFKTAIDAAELAFRTPFQNLTVEQGAVTLLDLSHSTDTGFNSNPSILKQEDDLNTGRSRKYVVRIDFGMPADTTTAPSEGIRDSSTNVIYTAARKRQVSISGIATAVAGTDSRAKYEAIIDAFCASILTGLGGTYELGDEPTTENDYGDKVLEFTRNYDEIIYSEAGVANDPEIVRMAFGVNRKRVAPGDLPLSGAVRLISVEARFSCWIDKTVTQDLEAKWENTIKEWVYGQMADIYSAGTLAVTDSTVSYDFTENSINGVVTGAIATGSSVISLTRTEDKTLQTGVTLVPAWNGDPLSKYAYQGPVTANRTVTIQKRILGTTTTGLVGGGVGGNPLANQMGAGMQFNFPGGGSFQSVQAGNPLANLFGGTIQFQAPGGTIPTVGGGGTGPQEVLISSRSNTTPLKIGLDGREINVTDITTTEVYQSYVPLPGSLVAGGL